MVLATKRDHQLNDCTTTRIINDILGNAALPWTENFCFCTIWCTVPLTYNIESSYCIKIITMKFDLQIFISVLSMLHDSFRDISFNLFLITLFNNLLRRYLSSTEVGAEAP